MIRGYKELHKAYIELQRARQKGVSGLDFITETLSRKLRVMEQEQNRIILTTK